jgi:hypothetical protein
MAAETSSRFSRSFVGVGLCFLLTSLTSPSVVRGAEPSLDGETRKVDRPYTESRPDRTAGRLWSIGRDAPDDPRRLP